MSRRPSPRSGGRGADRDPAACALDSVDERGLKLVPLRNPSVTPSARDRVKAEARPSRRWPTSSAR